MFYFFVICMMKKSLLVSLILLSGVLLTACENKSEENLWDSQSCSAESNCEIYSNLNGSWENVLNVAEKEKKLDYLVLVNKENKLPDNWENEIELVEVQNAYDETISVEKEAFEKYNELRDDLLKEWVDIELDSSYRSVEKQQQVWDDFEKEYGLDYTQKYVAIPWYSEHHTALAIDICIIKDGVLIYENDDMIAESDIFAKIHEKLADYGFILRYLEWKEDLTWYWYEPRHLRYVWDVNIAKEIMDNWLTLEEYLKIYGKWEPVKDWDNVTVDYIWRLKDGTVFDTSIESVARENWKYTEYRDYTEWLTFEVWAWQMIKWFDKWVLWMKVWQTKTVQFWPEEGYGEYDESLVMTAPIDEVGDVSQLSEWDTVYLWWGYPAKVKKITDKEVTFDMNHELAGKNLIFDITLKSINS